MKPRHPIAGLDTHEAQIRDLHRHYARCIAGLTALSLLIIAGLVFHACTIAP